MNTAATSVVLATQLVGSDELRVRLGEERADELRLVHDRLSASAVHDHDGSLIKGTGNRVLAVFGSASAAVAAAVDLQRAVGDYNASDEALAEFRVRIGISAGGVAIDDCDHSATPVIEAAGLCEAAEPGQILVAERVRLLTRNRGGHRFGPAEPRVLEGLSDSVVACTVQWYTDETTGSRTGWRRVRIIGPFEVEGVDPSAFGGRKARQFIRLLAARRGRVVPVDQIVEALWGDQPPTKPNDQVSVLASRVRSVLGADAVVRSDAGYALQVEWLDLDEFDGLVAEAGERLAVGSIAAARAAAEAALRLARGPLLVDDADALWADEERFAFERRLRGVLVVAAEAELASAASATAAQLAERALELDPFDEAALRVLLRAHRQSGRVASALATYARFRARLRDELGVSPSPETEALHNSLLDSSDESGDRRAPVPSVGPQPVRPPEPGDLSQVRKLKRASLAGRVEELAELDRQLDLALSGETRLVVVEGEPGIGKSTLVDVWVTGAEAVGLPVLVGRCDEVSRQLPLQAVLDALDRYLQGFDAEVAGELLGLDIDVLGPLLGAVSSASLDSNALERSALTSPAVVLGPGVVADQTRFFAALSRLLDAIAVPAGAVLVIDDLHFAGESTAQWLRFFQRRSRGRVLVVVATRTEGKPVLHPDTMIELKPLEFEAVVELVGDEERAQLLLERSGGHPLLLVELLHAAGDELPRSIRDATAARLRQMGSAGATVQSAAVLGDDIDLDLLASVLRRSPLEVLDDLERGLAHRFLDESGAAFVFRHALVREALASNVSAARRSLLHREAARVLWERGAADPLTVARHARAAGQLELAATMLAEAARHAADRHDRAEAIRLLDDAIELHDTAEYRLQRGVERMALGEYALAVADAEVARRSGADAHAEELLGWSLYYLRDFERARVAADAGARAAGDNAPLAASCLVLSGRVLQAAGDLQRADERMSEAEALVDDSRLPVLPIWIGSLRINQGRHRDGLALVERGMRQPGAIGHPFAMVHAHITRAHGLAQLGRVDEALVALDSADREVDSRDLGKRFAGRSANWRGWILRYLGAFEEADEWNQRAAEVALPLDVAEPVAHSLLDQADGALLRGDDHRAAQLLEDAAPYDEDEHAMRWRHALRRQLLNARLMLATGDWDGAEERALAVVTSGRNAGADRYVVLGSLVSSMVRAARGDVVEPADVETLLDRLGLIAGGEAWWWEAQLADRFGFDVWRARAERSVAELAIRAGAYRRSLERFAARVLS